MINENKFSKYLLANTLVRFFFALVTATVTLNSYKSFDSETLSMLLLAGVIIAGFVNKVLSKHFTALNKYSKSFVIYEALTVMLVCFAASITSPGLFLVATSTVWALTDAVMSSIWEDVKQKSGNGRELENRLRSANATGRTVGLIAAILISRFIGELDFSTSMFVVGASSWFENYYLRQMLD